MSSITHDEAERIARILFPGEASHGDCRNEWGRAAQPCRICADKNAEWQAKIKLVCDAVNNNPAVGLITGKL